MVAKPAQTIVLSGYYGYRNSGDEAVLKSILLSLEEAGQAAGVSIEPVVLSIDPEWTTRTYGVKSVHRMKLGEVRSAIKQSDGLISGGGSLLQDATGLKSIPYYLGVIKIAQWLKKPTFIYAQGIGPVNQKMFYPFISSVFRKCQYVSVRDTESAKLLHSMGVAADTVQVVPDPVMGLSLPDHLLKDVNINASSNVSTGATASTTSTELQIVGVSVRYWNAERKELIGLAEGLRQLSMKAPVHIRFLPFHFPGDEEASKYVMDLMGDVQPYGSKISVAEELENPQDMLAEVSRCSLLIGMRLHSLIYAASQEVPLLGISYDPKIDQFLARIDCSPVGTSSDLDADKLSSLSRELLEQGEQWRHDHKGKIAELRAESKVPAEQIVQYLRNKG